ncbi:MAG: EpsG family protein [Clostridia bacterium]|nr:EpsG family protein [Clostridia bacterium]
MNKEIVVYYGSIVLASLFAGLAQKFAKKENKKIIKLNRCLWIISFLLLLLPIGFRTCGVGVDDNNYKLMFDNTIKNGVIKQFLNTGLEPGYLLFNYFISLFTRNFQVIIFLTTFIPLVLYYKALEYEKDHINLFLGVFLFGTLLYLYFCGIIRLFIASSIIAFGLRYIIEKKTKKYIICIFIATLFHYSAFFLLFLTILSLNKKSQNRSKRWLVPVITIILPIVLYIIFSFVLPNLGRRYLNYQIGQGKISIWDFDKLPILLMCLILYNSIKKLNNNIYLYNLLCGISIVISIYTIWFPIGRIEWYCNFSICIILPSIIRAMKEIKKAEGNLILLPFIIMYAVIYSYRITFIQASRESMLNYSNFLLK